MSPPPPSAPRLRPAPETRPIFVPGRNCWRVSPAERVAFLVDGAAYFAAVAAAVEQARESVLILAWDIDSRVRLRIGMGRRDLPDELGAFLSAVLARRPHLEVHVLDWDFVALYATDRELLPRLKLGRRTHPRLHFRLDADHPVGGSHHQKVVVIDDSIAFVGGLDITSCRWDTPEHRAEDDRRVDPWGKPYRPFHDVQMMVAGEAAAALGDLARERWRRVTGETLRPPRRRTGIWPATVPVDVEDVDVAISRTDPLCGERAECREIEQLWIDAIAAARHFLYIESQYFTSVVVGDALARRLDEQDGPEVVVACTLENVGWLEEASMGVLRARLLRRLRAGDRHGRFRVYYPSVPGLAGKDFLKLHSKVLIVDDRLLRIGSANCNNRSMGLDTECDLAIDAAIDPHAAPAIDAFRDRLLAEHLGVPPATFARTFARTRSLIAAIEELSGGERTLAPLDGEVAEWLDNLVPQSAVVDPERPVEASKLVDEVLGSDFRATAYRPFLRALALVIGVAALGAAWTWGPLAEWVRPETVVAAVEPLRASPLAPLLVVLGFVVAGLAVFPVTVLIFATAMMFGAGEGLAYALVGTVASAAATYAIGRTIGKDSVDRWTRGRRSRLVERLRSGGVFAVALVRAVPVAPFTIVNLIAGAMAIPFGRYVAGTVLGMLPGMIGIVLLGTQVTSTVSEPGLGGVIALGSIVLALVLLTWWLRRQGGAAVRDS